MNRPPFGAAGSASGVARFRRCPAVRAADRGGAGPARGGLAMFLASRVARFGLHAACRPPRICRGDRGVQWLGLAHFPGLVGWFDCQTRIRRRRFELAGSVAVADGPVFIRDFFMDRGGLFFHLLWLISFNAGTSAALLFVAFSMVGGALGSGFGGVYFPLSMSACSAGVRGIPRL